MKPYFDYSDMENTIKYHIDDTQYMVLNFNAAYLMDMYVRKNEYTLHDSIFGAFGDESVRQSALAMMGYSIGLPAFILSKVTLTAFYASEDTKTPFYISIFIYCF